MLELQIEEKALKTGSGLGEEWSQANGENGAADFPVEGHIFPFQFQKTFGAGQEAENPDRGDSLRQAGRQRGTGDSPFEDTDKKRVKKGIQNKAEHNGTHRDFGISLNADDIIQSEH